MSTMESWAAYYEACEKRRERREKRLERANRSRWWYVEKAAHASAYVGTLVWTLAVGGAIIGVAEMAAGLAGCIGAALVMLGIGTMIMAGAVQEYGWRMDPDDEKYWNQG